MEILILSDNLSFDETLKSEHGLAFWVDTGHFCFLFDTGQGTAIAENAGRLGVPFEKLHAVVISHGHYDHTGGLREVLTAKSDVPVYLHPDAFCERYGVRDEAAAHSIGMPLPVVSELKQEGRRLIWTRTPVEIFRGVRVTGAIPRRTGFEDTGGHFFKDATCRVKDEILDDQAVWIETSKGLIVLVGCGHSGVVNTLNYISELTRGAPVYAVLGGMHLLNAGEERLERTVEALVRYGVKQVVPCHCTGEAPMKRLKDVFGEKCTIGFSGYRFTGE